MTCNMQAANGIGHIVAGKNVTPAQIALAWLMHQGEDILAIPGTKRVSYLEENLAAADISLSAEELGALAAAMSTVAGERYNKERMATVDR